MSIKRLVRLGSAALLGLLLAGVLIASVSVNAIRIGGPAQRQLQQSSDLVADILPPPAYVIEAYLEATQLVSLPQDGAARIARLQLLRRQYDERHEYWTRADLPSEIKRRMIVDSYRPAEDFWRAVDTGLIPAVRRNDATGARAAYALISDAYTRHRREIDALVLAAQRNQAALIQDADTTLTRTIILLVVLGLCVIAGTATASIMLVRRVITPLGDVAEVTTQLAAGARLPVPYADRTDEVGALSLAVAQFRDATQRRAEADAQLAAETGTITRTLADMLVKMASGDLRRQLTIDFPGEYAVVGKNMNQAIATLRKMVQTVVERADTIRMAADEIAVASQDLAVRTQSNAAALEQTSAALVTVDARIEATQTAAHQTAESAARARTAVDRGSAKAQSAAAAMVAVRDSANTVSGVMDALDKIAFQTRVLAMNAAIEAGSAGEAGHGFAVVADLVSQLAYRAEQEAQTARAQLTATADHIQHAVSEVEAVEQDFAAIVDDVGAVDQLLTLLTRESSAQAEAIRQIADAVRQIDMTTQQNAAMVEQTSAAAQGLLRETREMVDQANTFEWDRREVDLPVAIDRRQTSRSAPAAARGTTTPLLQFA